MNVILPQRMTVDEFLEWSVRQEKGRYELQDGGVIMQQSQNIAHLRTKLRVVNLLIEAIERAGVPFYALPDGATIRISPSTAYEPDALVAPLPIPAETELEIPNPVLVVEVLSPSSVSRDLDDKVAGYSRVPTIVHYLVIDPVKEEVIWHRRAAGDVLEKQAPLKGGTLRLDPPRIEILVSSIFPPP